MQAAPAIQRPAERVFDVGFYDSLPWWETAVLAVQNILGMTGMFLFPGILGAVFHLDPGDTARLYGATFVTSGLVTVLQGTFMLRLPIVMGPWAATFTAILVGGQLEGLANAYGSFFVASLIWAVLSLPIGGGAIIGAIAKLFREPLVYAGILVILMASLTTVTLPNWVGTPTQPGFGTANWLGGLACVVVIIAAIAFTRGLVRRGAMLWGIALGTVVYALFQPVPLERVAAAPWAYVPSAFPFGFGVSPSLVLLFFLMLTTGAASALSEYHLVAAWGEERVSSRRMSAGIFSESIGAALAAAVGGFSTTSYPDCLGILKTSRVGSVRVTITTGAILLVLGFVLKFDSLFVAVPGSVLAAAATVMFGIVLASGIEMLGRVRWTPTNSIVLGFSFMLSLGGLFINPDTLKTYPPVIQSILGQPVLTGTVMLVVLHLVLNVWLKDKLAQAAPAPRRDEPSPVAVMAEEAAGARGTRGG